MYTEADLVRIAKRENNKKRSYLVVNRLQGKHIPVSPKEAFQMSGELAELIKKSYPTEKLLLIGFAETATAIGAAIAGELDCYYIQTTRENIENVDYIYFSEAHSHATEQKLVKEDIESIIDKVDRIVFAEDEITTGNTILNIIGILQQRYSGSVRFAVASILNGMNSEARHTYKEKQIDTHYLVRTNHEAYSKIAETYKGDGVYHEVNIASNRMKVPVCYAEGYSNARRLVKGKDYINACDGLWNQVKDFLQLSGKSALVLGTEEFMFPALYISLQLELSGLSVKCHSTTRSPIAVSSEENYPFHERYELRSFYDRDRITYIYDLKSYENVIIVTDAKEKSEEGISSLINSLEISGNSDICIIKWN
ncbi:MAG: phosphoribosyl transferase [Lachnospiraceae bacterium]|nr:phosphoribosyl transferase [Lachnospiraceae bacterium]